MQDDQLEIADLEEVRGGMKWEHGHKSPNVVDARGGMFTFFGTTITFDRSGHVSSITH